LGEFLELCSLFSLSKSGGANGGGIIHGESPEVRGDGVGPVVFGKE